MKSKKNNILEKLSPTDYPINVTCKNKHCLHKFTVTLNNGAFPVGEIVHDRIGEYFFILCHYAICPICGEKNYIFSNMIPKVVLKFLEEESINK